MKTHSKKELQKKARKVFEQYPTAKQLFATVDGNIFLEKNRAMLHSKDTIYTFDRPAAEASNSKSNSSSKDDKSAGGDKIDYRVAIKTIQEAKTLEDIAPFEKDDRKSVKAAYDTKKEELEKNTQEKD